MRLHQTKKLLYSKGNYQQNEKLPTEWERIFANNKSDKGLIFKIYELIQFKYQKTPNHLILKWAKNLERHFSKEDVQTVNRHMKRCSVSLIIREMQIKATISYDLTAVRMLIIKKARNNKCFLRMWRKGDPCALLVGM